MFMKEIYEPAEMEVIEFENEDVITNSTPIEFFSNFSVQMNGDTLADFNQDFIPDDEE